jgi:ankyrin repeat protein
MIKKILKVFALGCGFTQAFAATDIHAAVTTMDEVSFQRLLDQVGMEALDEQDASGNTPLMVAAAAARLGAVKQLLARGVDARTRNHRKLDALGMVSLHMIARTEEKADAEALVHYKNCIEIKDRILTYLGEEGKAVAITGTITVREDLDYFPS